MRISRPGFHPWPSEKAGGNELRRYLGDHTGLGTDVLECVAVRMQRAHPSLAESRSLNPLTDGHILRLVRAPCGLARPQEYPLIESAECLVSVRNLAWFHVAYGPNLPARNHPAMRYAMASKLTEINKGALDAVDAVELDTAIHEGQGSIFALALALVGVRQEAWEWPEEERYPRRYAATALKRVMTSPSPATSSVELITELDSAIIDCLLNRDCDDFQ